MKEMTFDELGIIYQNLVHEAERVMANAYNPYSKFYVGAAILCRDGEIITGSNVENCAYGSTICAERMAIGRANAKGKRDMTAIAVIGKGESADSESVVGPCGSCRQMIFEFGHIHPGSVDVVMSNARKDKIIVATISELLPLAFGPRELGVDVAEYQQ